jgi:DNA-binding NarL/FixJ family response regulator
LIASERSLIISPDSKIIFLSQESDADVLQESLSLGARGYVLKAKAGSELLAAVETVISGKKFVSST